MMLKLGARPHVSAGKAVGSSYEESVERCAQFVRAYEAREQLLAQLAVLRRAVEVEAMARGVRAFDAATVFGGKA